MNATIANNANIVNGKSELKLVRLMEPAIKLVTNIAGFIRSRLKSLDKIKDFTHPKTVISTERYTDIDKAESIVKRLGDTTAP